MKYNKVCVTRRVCAALMVLILLCSLISCGQTEAETESMTETETEPTRFGLVRFFLVAVHIILLLFIT